jgi:type VI secretion system protein ImpA
MQAMLTAISESSPCGPNLEYDPYFVALETMARGKEEQQLGDNITPAEQPDWGAVRQQAESLLMRSKDVRVVVLLVRALVRVNNLSGLRDGLRILQGLLERYWDHLHPIDPDDPDDFTYRLNALALLGDVNALLLDVRCALVVETGPHGRVSVRDILVAAGRLQPAKGETVLSQTQIESAIAAAMLQDRGKIDAARDSLEAVNAIYSLLSDKVGTERASDLRPLSSMLKLVMQACNNATSTPSSASQESSITESRSDVAGPSNKKSSAAAEIQSREDATRALDAVCEFYEIAEPGNPAPLLIRRAQRLINKSFVEIIQDLAPDSLSQIRNIAGLKDG